jgi:acyl-CoA synthetase (AMP-forming)/AMP-acid ligase II
VTSFPFFNLGDLIDRARDPGKPAIVDLGGATPREVSFAALDGAANAVARALSRAGCARGERIAILSANRWEFVAAYFGIMRAGLVAVPVNFKFPRATIEYVLRDADARLAFCDRPRRDQLPADLPAVDFDDGFAAFLDPGDFAPVRPAAGETAMFLYTSGSTGRPKGVVLSHRSHLWTVQTRLAGNDWSRHRLLVAAPLYHMNALALAKLASAAHATVVLLPQFDARAYAEAIERYRATWLTAVPPMMAMMLRERALLDSLDLGSVEIVRMGSAPVGAALMSELRARFPRASIQNAYGTTEAGPVVFGAHPRGLPQPALSVGFAHPLVSLRLIGADGAPAAEGVLQIRSPALMTGYHKLPELTRAALTADGYYVTGDIFRRDDDGFHYFVGRTDDMFVSGGENIFPAEVERVLERHPSVEQAAVIAVPDDIKGAKPVAFAVLKPGRTASEQELKEFALANAPAYQHPRRVWFLQELPLAGTNKIDRAALAALAAARITATEETA